MKPNRETPNPYEAPCTLATGDAPHVKREPGPKLLDLKHQTIGFAVMTAAAVLGLIVGYGLMSYLMSWPPGGWLELARNWPFVILGPLMLVSFIAVPICGFWTVISAARWGMSARTGYTTQSEVTE